MKTARQAGLALLVARWMLGLSLLLTGCGSAGESQSSPGVSRLTWEPAQAGPPAAYYRVYVAPGASPTAFALEAETPETQVPLVALGLTPGEVYHVYVTAVSATNLESAPSATIGFRY